MSIYVDDMRAPFGRMIMCHMVADSHDELISFADKIGVARKWIQFEGEFRREHFDICLAKRKEAIIYGAKEITRRQLLEHFNRPCPDCCNGTIIIKDTGDQDTSEYDTCTTCHGDSKQ
jgi:hypothetical protein